ncbi:hypothetical protein ACJ41O_005578 [Fusarium nematophilum]
MDRARKWQWPQCNVDYAHFDIDRACNLCGVTLRHEVDEIVALYSRGFPAGAWKHTKTVFRRDGVLFQGDRVCLCHYGGSNTLLPGCAIVHKHCFDLFPDAVESKEALARLGRLLTWSKIYLTGMGQRRPRLVVPEPLGFSPAAVGIAQDGSDLSLMKRLPQEIVVMVHSYSEGAPFWTLVRALAVRLEYTTLRSDADFVTAKLTNAVSWKRGDAAPTLASDEELPELIRITLDARGVCQIERLAEYPPPFTSRRSDTKRFILADESRLRGLKMHFKDGLSWLWCPANHIGLQVWDTPTPPQAVPVEEAPMPGTQNRPGTPMFNFDGCAMRISVNPYSAFKTADLSRATGLTFLFASRGEVLETVFESIRVHTRWSPLAAAPLERTCLADNRCSIYVPLAEGDEILWMLIRKYKHLATPFYNGPVNFVLRTRLGGVMHVGPMMTPGTEQLLYCAYPKAIVTGNHDHPGGPFRAVYPESKRPKRFPEASMFPHVNGERYRLPGPRTVWSFAPLEKVRSARIFHDERRFLLGVIFEYENGARRAIGECKPGVDGSVTREKPTQVFFAILRHVDGARGDRRDKRRIRVEFGRDPRKEEYDLEWNRSDMVGELHYWRGGDYQDMRVLPEGSWRA